MSDGTSPDTITCMPSYSITTAPSYDPQPHWSFTDIAGPGFAFLLIAFVIAWVSYQIRAYNELAEREQNQTARTAEREQNQTARTAFDKGYEQVQKAGTHEHSWRKKD